MPREQGRTRFDTQTIRNKYPLFFVYGSNIKFLSHEESIKADANKRIESIWPYLVKSTIKYLETLRPREAANVDGEDVLSDLVRALLERDSKWDPDRGRYLTFAARIVANELNEIRDRAKTVHAPRNSSSRMKQYEADEKSGGMTDDRKKTMLAVKQVVSEQETLEVEANEKLWDSSANTVDQAAEKESKNISRLRAVDSLAEIVGLNCLESYAICYAYGTNKNREEPVSDNDAMVGLRRRAKESALKKIRKSIEEGGNDVIKLYRDTSGEELDERYGELCEWREAV